VNSDIYWKFNRKAFVVLVARLAVKTRKAKQRTP